MQQSLTLRQSKKAQTRLHIARVAHSLFQNHGFEAVSIVDIANEAGVSKMTVFNYFPAKEDIFFFLGDRLFPDFAKLVAERAAGDTPLDTIHRYVLEQFNAQAEWTGLHRGGETFGVVIAQSPVLMNALKRHWQVNQNKLAEAIAKVLAGEQQASALFMARVMAAQIVTTIQALIDENRQQSLELPQKELVTHAVTLTNQAFSLLRDGWGSRAR